jgi:hypothetical protein
MSITSVCVRRPAVAADGDRGAAGRGGADPPREHRPEVADELVVEVAVGDPSDVVLAEDLRVHRVT